MSKDRNLYQNMATSMFPTVHGTFNYYSVNTLFANLEHAISWIKDGGENFETWFQDITVDPKGPPCGPTFWLHLATPIFLPKAAQKIKNGR